MRKALFVASSIVLAAACSGGGPSRSRVQRWADALAAGDGSGACDLVCAHRDQLARRCAEQRDWIRVNAPAFPGSRVSIERVSLTSGGTQATVRVTGTSARGTTSFLATFACANGREQYPMSCPDPGDDAWWVFELAR